MGTSAPPSRIREDLVYGPAVQKEIVTDCYKTRASESEGKKWIRAMASVKAYLLEETKKRKKKPNLKTREQIEALRKHTTASTARQGATIINRFGYRVTLALAGWGVGSERGGRTVGSRPPAEGGRIGGVVGSQPGRPVGRLVLGGRLSPSTPRPRYK